MPKYTPYFLWSVAIEATMTKVAREGLWGRSLLDVAITADDVQCVLDAARYDEMLARLLAPDSGPAIFFCDEASSLES